MQVIVRQRPACRQQTFFSAALHSVGLPVHGCAMGLSRSLAAKPEAVVLLHDHPLCMLHRPAC